MSIDRHKVDGRNYRNPVLPPQPPLERGAFAPSPLQGEGWGGVKPIPLAVAERLP
jgi:hypothetical protein